MHYQRKLRERVKSAALHFGDCLDKAVNQMLLDHKNSALKPADLYVANFHGLWTNVKVLKQSGNEELESAITSNGIAYAESDFDKDLLMAEDVTAISNRFELIDNVEDVLKKYYAINALKKEKGLENLHEKSVAFLNAVNWYTLKTKGSLILLEYYRNVIQKIVKVYEIQKTVSLEDGTGNTIIGYVDAVLDLGEGPVICDFKTSSMTYEASSASNSEQMALYRHCLRGTYDTKNVCFIVAYKHIQKVRVKTCSSCGFTAKDGSMHKTCYNENSGRRCGQAWNETISLSAKIEMVPGLIDETFENFVVENFDSVLRGIEHGVFTKNWANCEAYNRKCAYYYLCRKGSDSKLVQVE
mgnify:FL=1